MEGLMDKWIHLSAGFAAGIILLSGTALAQEKPAGCEKTGTPEKVQGQVVKIDPDQAKVTGRGPKGEAYEFHASKETLQSYKVGDPIEAKLRSAPNCKSSAS